MQDAIIHFWILKVDVYEKLEAGMRQIEPAMVKLGQRAAEKDPEKQTYGPTMIKKIEVGRGVPRGANFRAILGAGRQIWETAKCVWGWVDADFWILVATKKEKGTRGEGVWGREQNDWRNVQVVAKIKDEEEMAARVRRGREETEREEKQRETDQSKQQVRREGEKDWRWICRRKRDKGKKPNVN